VAARSAVGFLETRGLTGAIAGADAAAKTADVRIGPFERIGDGLVSIRFQGDVAAVQAAVLAAVEAASRVGTVVSHHVIPAPDPRVGVGLVSAAALAPATAPEPTPVGAAAREVPPARSAATPLPAPAARTAPADPPVDYERLERLPVARLRQLLRHTPGAALKGRQVSRAGKAELIAELERLRPRP
jgi:microcompartment protein CcmL/EutN